jgi:2-polyprenyl-3-methyl-5-hydroxy-6-metoxy-1,4-benzoquinol methylase
MSAQRDFLLPQLYTVPVFRALLRSIEARMIASIKFPHPILDLGCGDGQFAQMAFTEPLDVGIDPMPQAIAEARTRGMHRDLRVMDSNQMSFADGMFGSVMSNSVLEHIPDIDATLRETNRVLKPGGMFVFTTPNQHYAEYMFFSAVFNKLGLPGLAKRYGDHFNRIAHHYRTDSKQVWTERLEQYGFSVVKCTTYFSRQASHVFDLAHYYSSPTILYKKMIGRWVIAPWRINFILVEPLLRRYYDEPPCDDGASLLFVCERT